MWGVAALGGGRLAVRLETQCGFLIDGVFTDQLARGEGCGQRLLADGTLIGFRLDGLWLGVPMGTKWLWADIS